MKPSGMTNSPEIGETHGLTRERVRQIETEALDKLAESIDGTPAEAAY